MFQISPHMTPIQAIMGTNSRPPASTISDAYASRNRVKTVKRRVRSANTTSLTDLISEINLKHGDDAIEYDNNQNIIFLQTNFMVRCLGLINDREVYASAMAKLGVDTVEGFIHDKDASSDGQVHQIPITGDDYYYYYYY